MDQFDFTDGIYIRQLRQKVQSCGTKQLGECYPELDMGDGSKASCERLAAPRIACAAHGATHTQRRAAAWSAVLERSAASVMERAARVAERSLRA